MPHITIEISSNLVDILDIPALLTDCHKTLSGLPDIAADRVKTRAVIMPYSIIGEHDINDKNGKMVHITIQVLQGRDITLRQTYTQHVFAAAKKHIPNGVSLTTDLTEITPQTYCQ